MVITSVGKERLIVENPVVIKFGSKQNSDENKELEQRTLLQKSFHKVLGLQP